MEKPPCPPQFLDANIIHLTANSVCLSGGILDGLKIDRRRELSFSTLFKLSNNGCCLWKVFIFCSNMFAGRTFVHEKETKEC